MIIGLTGQTGAGKSTVCEILKEKCIKSIDCDKISREITADNSPVLDEIESHFNGVVNDGVLDRTRLGIIVFGDKEKKAVLEGILFPHIIKKVKERLNEFESETAVFLDAPTLFESGLDKICDKTLAVVASEKSRLDRILVRDKIDTLSAITRMRAQNPETWFYVHCDKVIANDGDLHNLETELLAVLKEWGIL